MEPIAFVAASAEEAVAQIRARLGPEAVVLNVRPLPAHGLARLWQKPMIEVLAYRPESAAAPTAPLSDALAEFRQRLDQIEQHVNAPAGKTEAGPAVLPEYTAPVSPLDSGGWRIGEVLQKTGLLPLHAQRVLDQVRSQHGDRPPPSLGIGQNDLPLQMAHPGGAGGRAAGAGVASGRNDGEHGGIPDRLL
ncbi:MAG: hypothetical protein ABSG78_14140 [Verrucomicrobiota bacterium]